MKVEGSLISTLISGNWNSEKEGAHSQDSGVLVELLRKELLGPTPPSAKDLTDLKGALEQVDPVAYKELGNTIRDCLALADGKPYAPLLRAIRRGESIKCLDAFRDAPSLGEEGYEAMRDALMEGRKIHRDAFHLLQGKLSAEDLAGYINKNKILLKNLKDLDRSLAESLAPHLSFCNLSEVDPKLQEAIMSKVRPENILTLFLNGVEIQELPDLPYCRHLTLKNCHHIKSLPNLGNCLRLAINHCKGLESLPDELDKCEHLSCTNCSKLRWWPIALPNCRTVDYQNSHQLRSTRPPVGPNCTVTGPREEPFRMNLNPIWNVRLKELSNPRHLLMELSRRWLSLETSFPSIRFLLPDGSASRGLDAGGPKRELVTNVLSELFKPIIQIEDPEKLVTHLLMEGDGLPYGRDGDREAYRGLGQILGLCFKGEHNLLAGPLFDEKVYKMLQQDDPSAMVYLNNSVLKQLSPLVNAIEDVDWTAVDKDTLIRARFLIDPEFEDESLDDMSQLRLRLNTAHGKETFRQEFKVLFEAQLKAYSALHQIQKGMKQALSPQDWSKFCSTEPKLNKERIEGSLSKERLLAKIKWKKAGSATDENYKATQAYLRSWIERQDNEVLGDFVQFVTGNRTLGNPELEVEIGDPDHNPLKLPVSHTCANWLQLTEACPNQESFDEKLQMAIAEALESEGGFQFA